MGNIRTKGIKKASHELIGMYPERFNKEFDNNKQVMQELKLVDSKIVRNKIAGYITRVKKQRKTAYRRVEREDRAEGRGRGAGRGGFGGRGSGMRRGRPRRRE